MKKYKKLISSVNSLSGYREAVVIFVFSCLYITGMFLILKIPGCGYHLIDDHEFTAWTYLLKDEHASLLGLISGYLEANLGTGRWRPLYLIMRGLFISVFGTNITLYYIWAIIKTIIAFILIYYMARTMKGSVISSWLCAIIALTGYQSATWWKLGTHEIVSAIWFALGMIFMIRYLDSESKKCAMVSFASFLIMSLYKESYIVLIPFVFLYALSAGISDTSVKVKQIWSDAVTQLRSHVLYMAGLVLIFAANAAVILVFGKVDYLADQDTAGGIHYLVDSFSTDLKWFILFGLLMAVILISHDTKALKLWKDAILLCAFVLPQCFVYAHSGLTERYILPFSIGYALFFCIMAPHHLNIGRIRNIMYYAMMVLLILAHIRAALFEGNYYRLRGESVTKMLELADQYADRQILSFLVSEGSDLIYTTELLNGHDNVYEALIDWEAFTFSISPVRYSHYVSIITSQPELDSYDDLTDIDVVIMYNRVDRHWEYDPLTLNNMDITGFTPVNCGTIDVYIRNP